jgi:hypothetical protein
MQMYSSKDSQRTDELGTLDQPPRAIDSNRVFDHLDPHIRCATAS